MKKSSRCAGFLFVAVMIVVFLFVAGNAGAYIITLDTPNTAISGFTGPYAQVDLKFTDRADAYDTMEVTVTALGNYKFGGNLGFALNIGGLVTGFNIFNDQTGTWSALNEGVSKQVDGFGKFNWIFEQSNMTSTVTVLTLIFTGEWDNAETFFNTNGGLLPAAAHIYTSGGATGWASTDLTNVPNVPVPPSVWLLGSGLVGLIGLRRRFHRK